jgi:ABC-type branched-subunit amino acid transport system substrate-binding protein
MTVAIDQPPPGLFAEQNRSIMQGAEVAAQELNAAGGLARHVHLRLVSQKLDGLSASALKSRLQSETAAALILPCDTDSQFTMAAEAARSGTLMLAPCNADPQAGHDFPTYWPVGAAASDETLELASFMQVIGRGNVFVVETPGSRYVQLLTSWFRNAAQRRKMQVVGTASVAMSTSNFASLAHAIQAAHPAPSAIFTALPPPYVNRLAAGLAAHGVSQAVVGTAVMDTPLTLAKGGEALNNAVFSTLGFPRESSAARRFAADYREQFHKSPVGGFADVGLETVRLLADAAAKAHSAAPQAIQRALKGGIVLPGVGLADRSYQAGGDHNPIGEVAIEKIASDAFLPLFAGVPSGGSSGR